MGLFSFFGKKKNSDDAGDNNKTEPVNSAVKIDSTTDGKHGDHWGALFGFEYFFEGEGASKFQESMNDILQRGTGKTGRNNTVIITTDFGRVFTRAVVQNENLITLSPGISTARKIPAGVREIIEWKHVGGLEAQVVASGRGKFMLHFFADDYTENEAIYKTVPELDLHLAGIAYVMQPWSPDELKTENDLKFADDFVCYMPDSEQGKYSCIQYLGQAVAVEEVKANGLDHCHGYIVTTKLINDPEQEDFFVLDIFVHADHLREMEKPKPGDRVSGVCWLHGRIAGAMGLSMEDLQRNN